MPIKKRQAKDPMVLEKVREAALKGAYIPVDHAKQRMDGRRLRIVVSFDPDGLLVITVIDLEKRNEK